MTAPADVVGMLAPCGRLRVVINLGNPVQAQGTAADPRGLTVDIARVLAAGLAVPLDLVCTTAAKDGFRKLVDREVDLGFLAIEPARAEQVAFGVPFTVIEAVFAVPDGSPITDASGVDRPGIRVGVKEGSAYDLFLTRSLRDAALVRGVEGTEVFERDGLEAVAGLRRPLSRFAQAHSLRVLEPAFQQIRHAVALPLDAPAEVIAYVDAVVEELKVSGFVADSLRRSGRDDAQVAP